VADVSSHAPGSFSWAELATTDQASGVAFYRALFDWGVDESPAGPGEMYSMFQLRGRPVAAAYTMRPEERQGTAVDREGYLDLWRSRNRLRTLGAGGGFDAFLASVAEDLERHRLEVVDVPYVFSAWSARSRS
jgi:hypothetical protein